MTDLDRRGRSARVMTVAAPARFFRPEESMIYMRDLRELALFLLPPEAINSALSSIIYRES